MQSKVGYKLIDNAGNVFSEWGGVWGNCPPIPFELRLPDGAVVCAPSTNEVYNGYTLIDWMMDEPLPEAPPVPQQVPMWAVRTVLQTSGLFDLAQTTIQASDNVALKNIWEYGNFAERSSVSINSLASQLQLTNEQVDQLFRDADALNI